MDSKRKSIINSSVLTSIDKLLDQARRAYGAGNLDRSKRYVEMAFDLLKKHKARLPKEMKNSFCRKCKMIWIPGKTVTVAYDRKNDYLRVSCNSCGYSKRL